MAKEREDNRYREWRRFWESASGLWRGVSAWRIWLLCASLVAMVALQLHFQFRLNYWNRDFFDALESRDPERLQAQAILLIPLCGASVVLAATSVWGRMTVQRKWREWLTNNLIDYWVDNNRYTGLSLVQGNQKIIPEYRIAEDVRIATDAPVDFALGLVSSLLTAVIFIQVLWNVGGDASFSVFGYRLWIPGYLVGSVAVYAGIVTTAMILVGSPLTRVIQIKNQAEAELITAAHLLRDIGEGVMPKQQEADVRWELQLALRNVLAQWRRPVLAARAYNAGVARKHIACAHRRACPVFTKIPDGHNDARRAYTGRRSFHSRSGLVQLVGRQLQPSGGLGLFPRKGRRSAAFARRARSWSLVGRS
ncbi:putative ATP-binding cassette transporter [Bradyrhizobium sp. JR6.1]